MNIRMEPHELAGTAVAMPSKSVAHRLVTLAALADHTTEIALSSSSEDIEATLRCVEALGASVERAPGTLRISPLTVREPRRQAQLDVGESGSTLRFLLPVIAALGTGATVTGHGRLAERPLAPLDAQLREHGATISTDGSFPLEVSGRLAPGRFRLPGSVSSQFVSGLLMAAPLVGDKVLVNVEEPVESKGYIDLTMDALATFGVTVREGSTVIDGVTCRTFSVPGDQRLVSPGTCEVEGDWSNAAFWLAAGALQDAPLTVAGLNPSSRQGDRSIMAALSLLGARIGRGGSRVSSSRDLLHGHDIDVSGIPDLAAPLAVVAAYAEGTTRLRNAGRLRLKESDRLATISGTIRALGGHAAIQGDDLVIDGVERLTGGVVDASGDHRIAMMAAVCATHAAGPTLIRSAECVAKSYPTFFEDLEALGVRVVREAE